MECDVPPREDYSHTLAPGEHEAFYFCFTTPDASCFGWLRLLVGGDQALEMLVLRSAGRTWVHQRRAPFQPLTQPVSTLQAGKLSMRCVEPWQRWELAFDGDVAAVEESATLPLRLKLSYRATSAPTGYRYGLYYQVQADGRIAGALRLGDQALETPALCYRDHSWGQRQMGIVSGYDVLVIPERFYGGIIRLTPGPFAMGRVIAADGALIPVHQPIFSADGDGGWVEDPQAGLNRWTVRRLVKPVAVFLGPAGFEEVRNVARPGDLMRDELGPAVFTSAEGVMLTGFWEHGKELAQ